MTIFDVVAGLTTLAALFGWVNHRFIRLPTTIGLMVISIGFSLGLVFASRFGVHLEEPMRQLLAGIDFDDALLNGMLGALLFAGALHIDLASLTKQRGVIALLATVGVLVSTVVVGTLAHLVLGRDVPLAYCLLFGALISPTDPIAVGAILRKVGLPASLLTKISGESLFNDGVGVVVFLVLLEIAAGGGAVGPRAVVELVALEVVGGLVYGALLGWVVYRMLKSVDNYQVEILLTLGLVTGGYALAHHLHLSGPLAMVVAGLLIGNQGRSFAMSDQTRERLDAFWELVDEFLNALLFVLIGIEVLVLDVGSAAVIAGLILIPVVLLARWVSVAGPITLMRRHRKFSPGAVGILTWSGLRGGISVALALSLPQGGPRDLFITVTYVVVVFSIVVQGLTIGPFARRLAASGDGPLRPSDGAIAPGVDS